MRVGECSRPRYSVRTRTAHGVSWCGFCGTLYGNVFKPENCNAMLLNTLCCCYFCCATPVHDPEWPVPRPSGRQVSCIHCMCSWGAPRGGELVASRGPELTTPSPVLRLGGNFGKFKLCQLRPVEFLVTFGRQLICTIF